MKDRRISRIFRVSLYFPDSGSYVLWFMALLLWNGSLGCKQAPTNQDVGVKRSVVAASGDRPVVASSQDHVRGIPPVGASADAGALRVAEAKRAHAGDAVAQVIPVRYAYPRSRRVPLLEGIETEETYRFVQVSEDSLRQVVRFYRKRFPLAPYQYGENERTQYLFAQGGGEDAIRVRVAPLEAELDGFRVKAKDRTVISIRARPPTSDPEEPPTRQEMPVAPSPNQKAYEPVEPVVPPPAQAPNPDLDP